MGEKTEQKHHKKSNPEILVKDVKRNYTVGDNRIDALRGVSLEIRPSDFTVIYGPSGCGKSTLLNIIAGIDKPSHGEVKVRGTNLFKLSDDVRAEFRSKKIGMVHQMPYWVKSLNVLENVALPLIIEGKLPKHAYERASLALQDTKIFEFAKRFPTQLSGGQQQRVGIARSLVCDPWIIMADEPTGNLDSSASDEIMALLDYLNRKSKRTVVLVTHNQAYWDVGTMRIEMKDGLIVNQAKHL